MTNYCSPTRGNINSALSTRIDCARGLIGRHSSIFDCSHNGGITTRHKRLPPPLFCVGERECRSAPKLGKKFTRHRASLLLPISPSLSDLSLFQAYTSMGQTSYGSTHTRSARAVQVRPSVGRNNDGCFFILFTKRPPQQNAVGIISCIFTSLI